MLVLENTDLLEVVTTSANSLHVAAFYADNTAAAFTPDKQVTAIAAAATTTFLSAPAAATTRNVSHISFRAVGGANTLTVRFNNGAAFELQLVALASGERLEYENGKGWSVYDAAGAFKQSIAAGAGSIALTSLATQAANTIVANATAGVASPTAVAVSAQALLLRAAGNLTDTVAAADQVLRRSGAGDLGFGTLVTNHLGNNQVTNAKLAQMAARTAKGNDTNATADPIDLTADQTRECFAGGCLTQTTAQSRTNSTTNITPGAYTIPANMAQVGSEYECYAYIHVSRGATATAANLIIELLINGVVIRTITLVIVTTASTFGHAICRGIITFRTIGAGGTAMVTLGAENTVEIMTTTPQLIATRRAMTPAPATAAPATTAVDTTVTRTVELRARMSAAVAGLTIYAMDMTIQKVR